MASNILPPHSIEAEEATLGSLLIDPPAIPVVARFLPPAAFYLQTHQWLYEAMLSLGDKADLLTVTQELERAGKLQECGGEGFIARLTATVPTALNVETYARTVEAYAIRRRVIEACSGIAKLAFDERQPVPDVIDKSQSLLLSAVAGSARRQTVTLAEAAEQVYAEVDAVLEHQRVPGVSTGISAVDHMIGGMKPGRLYTFAGLPGTGKTTLMLNLLLNAARAGHTAAMFSCEMTEAELLSVCVSNRASMSLSAGDLVRLDARGKAEARARLADALQEVVNLPLILRSASGMTPAEFRFECKSLQLTRGLKVAAADYIQIMRPNINGKDTNREQEVSSIAWGLKETAMELGIAVLCGSQVNDDGQVRESRAIEQHTDSLVLLKAGQNGGEASELTATFRKNRGGPTGDITLAYRKAKAHIGGVRTA